MNKILVTGASGNIGTALVAALQHEGADFEVMRSKPQGAGATAVRVGSYDDVASLAQAFTGIDTLFVLLPLVPHKLALAANVAQAAKAAGVKHILRSSGAGADPKAGFSLPALQGQVDQLMQDTGIPTTFLRPAGFMQNYATFLAGMAKGGSVYGATSDAAQSLIDVRDIAAVAAKVLVQPAAHVGQAYTLTGGEALTDQQRMALIGQAIGRPVQYVNVPLQAAEDSMRQMGMPDALVGWLSSLNALVAAGYAGAISPDVERLLGRAPITFSQFAHDHKTAWL